MAGLISAVFWLRLLVHISDGRLIYEKICIVDAMHLDTVFVVPFDHPANCLPSVEDYHHGRASLHLLDVIKTLRVGLLRRGGLSSLETSAVGHLVLNFRERWTNQFTVHVGLLL